MIDGILLVIGAAIVIVAASAAAAVGAVGRARLREIAGGSGRGARAVLDFVAQPRRTAEAALVASQIGLVVAASVVAQACSTRIPWPWAWIPASLLLALLLGWARLWVRQAARRHAERAALLLVLPLRLFDATLRPVAVLAAGASRAVLALCGVQARDAFAPRPTGEPAVDAAPVRFVGSSTAPGEVLQQVLDFGGTPIVEVMVPRTEVVGVEVGTSVRDAVARIREHRFSRMPVYREDLDHTVGMIHQFDLFRARGPEQPVEALMRPIPFVPETKLCDDLLREMQQSGQGMAVVLDEFGGTAGVVTLEDLLEQLVGELGEGEGDRAVLRPIDDRTAVADGRVSIDEINEALHLDLPEGDYETLAGFVLDRLGRIPHRGEVVSDGNVRIEVLNADRRRIRILRVERTEGGDHSEERESR
jgi:CBS domain containing-hemolysin-like protein